MVNIFSFGNSTIEEVDQNLGSFQAWQRVRIWIWTKSTIKTLHIVQMERKSGEGKDEKGKKKKKKDFHSG